MSRGLNTTKDLTTKRSLTREGIHDPTLRNLRQRREKALPLDNHGQGTYYVLPGSTPASWSHVQQMCWQRLRVMDIVF